MSAHSKTKVSNHSESVFHSPDFTFYLGNFQWCDCTFREKHSGDPVCFSLFHEKFLPVLPNDKWAIVCWLLKPALIACPASPECRGQRLDLYREPHLSGACSSWEHQGSLSAPKMSAQNGHMHCDKPGFTKFLLLHEFTHLSDNPDEGII